MDHLKGRIGDVDYFFVNVSLTRVTNLGIAIALTEILLWKKNF